MHRNPEWLKRLRSFTVGTIARDLTATVKQYFLEMALHRLQHSSTAMDLDNGEVLSML